MKKYKLKKDLLNFKSGEEVTIVNDCITGGDMDVSTIRSTDDKTHLSIPVHQFKKISLNEWFEEIQETPKSIWDLKEGDICYLIRDADVLDQGFFGEHADLQAAIMTGDIFVDEREAESELARRLAIQKIKEFIHENGMEFLPDWEDMRQIKYTITYFHQHGGYGEFGVEVSRGEARGLNLPYFSKPTDAEKIIESFPDQLKIICIK